LAEDLGIGKKVIFSTNVVSQNFMPYLLSACDIYAAPSRLEGFGMIQVEANACEKPVIAIDAMAFRDTMVHGETAFLAKVAEERKITEAIYGEGHDYEKVIVSCFQIRELLNTEPACLTSQNTFFFSCRTALCGSAWEKRAANAWSIYSTIARLPGNLWRSFPTDWVSSRKQRGANVLAPNPTLHRGIYVIRREFASPSSWLKRPLSKSCCITHRDRFKDFLEPLAGDTRNPTHGT
jgi:hypothetical protein